MRFSAILVVLCVAAYIDAATGKENVVAAVGDTVKLACGTSTEEREFFWTKLVDDTDHPETTIYNSKIGDIEAPKYAVEGYTLTIKNLMIKDGGFYKCTDSNFVVNRAAVIVVEKPTVSFVPSFDTLEMGKTVTVTCTANFGGAHQVDMEKIPGIVPTMSLWIGGQKKGQAKTEWSSTIGVASKLSVSANFTAATGDRDTEVKCRVITSDPVFSVEDVKKIGVKYPVGKVDYVPKQDTLEVGQTLNCTADSNPEPVFTWHPLSSPGGRTIQSSVLSITEQMIGANKWECRVADYTPTMKRITVEFTVLAAADNTDNTNPKEVSSGPESWKVAVGVVVPIVFICILAIVIILYMMKKRRQRESSEEVKGSAHHHPNGDSGYDEQAPREAPVTPNPTGYPAYPGPYAPEGGSHTEIPQAYPGRNSPGYADLGVRHLGQTNPGVDTHVASSPDPVAPNRGYSNEVYDQSPRQQESVLSTGPDPGSVV